MKTSIIIKSTALAFALVCNAKAQSISYQINTDTSALVGNISDPFAIDFQFIDGEGAGDGNNTVRISDFNFHGGGWDGADPGAITLHDTTFFSEFFEQFTAGTSLSFTVNLTDFADAGGTPDSFSFALLGSNLLEVPTTGFADSLVAIDLTSPTPSVATGASDLSLTDINVPTPTIERESATTPDVLSTGLVLAMALCLIAGLRRSCARSLLR